MKRKLAVAVSTIVLGLGLTIASSVISVSSGYWNSVAYHVRAYAKGWPLPYLGVEPSSYVPDAREPFTLLWFGNAGHQLDPLVFLVDIAFWTGVSVAVVIAIMELWLKRQRHRHL